MSANEPKTSFRLMNRMLAAVAVAALACACLVAAGTFSPRQALAAQDATLTVVLQHGSGSSATNIDGAKLEAYEVARIGASGSYELLSAYESTGIDFNEQMTASQSLKAAEKLSQAAAGKEPSGSATTGSDGKAGFGQLEEGIYLVVQTGAAGTAEKYSVLPPFLVNVPQVTDDGIVYDVVAAPKPEVKPEKETTPPDKTTKKTTSTPKTGDMIGQDVVVGCCIIGCAALLCALAAARRLRSRERSE